MYRKATSLSFLYVKVLAFEIATVKEYYLESYIV